MNPLNPHRKSRGSPTPSATPPRRSPSPQRSSPAPPPFPPPAPPAFPRVRAPSRAARGIVTTAALLLIPLLVFAGGDDFRAALDFTTGVLSLVALTASVMWGLVASDRLFLRSRQRLLAQAVHRATAIASVGFLLLHATVKLALDHVSVVGALVPFGLGFTGGDGLIGLGSLAGLLMITTSVTGALRSAFASPVQVASRWRALHMLAYPAWCAALLHGLYAGRPPKPWVMALYCLCLVAVAGAVALRAAPRPVKRKVAARIFALLEPDDRPTPDRSRRREAPTPTRDTASAPLPGTASGRAATSPDQPPVVGIAAAYRALAAPSDPDASLPLDLQPTEVLPTVAPRWPAPSPPPPAEAPTAAFPHASPDDGHDSVASGHDPLDTQHDYGDRGFGSGDTDPYGTSYDTGPQPAYHPPVHDPLPAYHPPVHDPVYDDGPATQQLPGPFQAPSTGEPWHAPTGGGK
ncbi:cytochrome b/b6 domain-containing protein [Streptomyces flavofungini]|uniref:cytochrome b/b6 domain-containing protein n=1 Tax=Streptomyces flavofungini TaxID=68200 RepID=UPI0025B20D61|nr:cytochrome b/b6 domain-containing protein [Streptomyces flavofungini]WJV48748.1 cytochrome b/b6 domain-containing protein [Streptomyces flavofungini]